MRQGLEGVESMQAQQTQDIPKVTSFREEVEQPAKPVALKEWAVICRALAEGEQILIMRKGGIREETKHFSLQTTTFYLFPAYEHQKAELLKKEHQHKLEQVLAEYSPEENQVQIDTLAQVTHDIEIRDPKWLEPLIPYHIWEPIFAEKRLRWKPYHPLHLLLLRTYRLTQPVTIPMEQDYQGCKSWVELKRQVPEQQLEPVLSDEAFASVEQQILELFR